jgi:ketosteroid isomerase-like protein
MSQENVEIVVGVFENTNARDFGAVMDAYADDVVLALHGEVQPFAGEGAMGKKAVGEWFGDWFRTFDRDYRFAIEESRDLGDRVLVIATHHGRGRGSGVPVELQAGWIYTVRDGRISRCDMYTNPREAREAAGLSQ